MMTARFATTRSAARAQASDDELIAAARAGDLDAFGMVYERYRDRVYAFLLAQCARREDAEDLVQEAFCRAWQAIRGFRGESKLLTWLLRIATNLCIDRARRSKRAPREAVSLDAEFEPEVLDDSDPADLSLSRQAVREALAVLSPEHRALVVLCDLQGLSCVEAAQVLECSPVSVRVRLCRARRRLRMLFSKVQA